jgi:hypothetical protein
MDKESLSCFPSTKTIAEETALSERAVCTHLEKAVADKWILKTERFGLAGRRWKRSLYTAKMPNKALNHVQHLKEKGTERRSEGTEPDDNKALSVVQSNYSYNYTKNQLRQGTEPRSAPSAKNAGPDFENKSDPLSWDAIEKINDEQFIRQFAEGRFKGPENAQRVYQILWPLAGTPFYQEMKKNPIIKKILKGFGPS